MLPDGTDWTKATYTLQIVDLLQAVRREVSPHLSTPTYAIGIGAGGTVIYQIACATPQPAFQAYVSMGPIRLPYPLAAPTDETIRVLVYGGRKDVEVFDRNLRHGHSVRGNTRVSPVMECLCEESDFTVYKGYSRSEYSWAPGLTVRQLYVGKDPEHIVWSMLLSDPDWLLADHLELP